MNFTIEFLNELAAKINAYENMEDFENAEFKMNGDTVEMDDVIKLMEALKNINKTKLTAVVKVMKKKPKANKKVAEKSNEKSTSTVKTVKTDNVAEFTKESVMEIFETDSNAKIMKYKLKQLQEMYFALYLVNAPKSKRKQDIVDDVKNYIASIKRAELFD